MYIANWNRLINLIWNMCSAAQCLKLWLYFNSNKNQPCFPRTLSFDILPIPVPGNKTTSKYRTQFVEPAISKEIELTNMWSYMFQNCLIIIVASNCDAKLYENNSWRSYAKQPMNSESK